MIKRPRIKSYLTTFPISDNAWGIGGGSDELWRINLNDQESLRTFTSVLPYLNGKYSVDEIVQDLRATKIAKNSIYRCLAQLEKMAFIEEDDSSELSLEDRQRYRDQISFFSRFTSSGGGKFQAKIRQARIGLVDSCELSQSVRRSLVQSGFGNISILRDPASDASHHDGWQATAAHQNGSKVETFDLDRESIWSTSNDAAPPAAVIVPQEAHDPLLLEAMDSFSKKSGVPWMLIRALDPHEGWVGPFFIPGETASYLSLEARLRGNMPFFEEYNAFDGHLRKVRRPSSPVGGLTSFFDLLSAMAVTEIVKYVTGISIPHLAGRFLTVNLLSWETELHEVLRLPRLEAESHSRPGIFPWKGVPYADSKTRRS